MCIFFSVIYWSQFKSVCKGLIPASIFHCFEQMSKFIPIFQNTFGNLKVGQNMCLLDTLG